MKLAIIGKGTAGCFSCTHFLQHTDWEIDWIYDSTVPEQSVGEGANLILPTRLHQNINFEHVDLEKVNGTYKSGIYKENWGIRDYMHTFPPPQISYHFSANKLQKFIFDTVCNNQRINLFDKKVQSHDEIDADYILDCTGVNNLNYEDFELNTVVPVNSAYVMHVPWEYNKFSYTLTIARPYGWIFGIPLTDRCSFGYMYNNELNSLAEIEKDMEDFLSEKGYNTSNITNSFSFKNYYRKKNFHGRVAYNGNSSFFLEPLEATSIHTMDIVQRLSYNYFQKLPDVDVNYTYTNFLKEIEIMISCHYIAGSRFDTSFWNYAQEKARKFLKDEIQKNEKFYEIFTRNLAGLEIDSFGTWEGHSWKQNITNLGIENLLDL